MNNIVHQRLHNQHLSEIVFDNPVDVVAWLGAVQSQDYAGAKWAVGQRFQGAVDSSVEAAFTDGSILRTHVMRPTWHFVTAADIRWILALTAPRVHALNAYYYRQLELDEALLNRTKDCIAKALEGGKQLTRAELGTALAEAGIVAEGMRLGYIVSHAELDALVCSGPRRGKQFTYALLDERAPNAKKLEHDDSLAELTRRFFTGHGPATVQDFAWWSGLTVADIKTGIDMVKSDLAQEVIEDQTYWFSATMTPPKPKPQTVYMLPNYDEYISGYTDRSAYHPVYMNDFTQGNFIFNHILVIDGKVVGTWKRTFKKREAIIETNLFKPLTDAENEAFAAAAQRFGEFLDMPVVIA